MVHFFEKGFSKLTIDVATSFVVMLFLDELRIRIKNFGSHRLYLNAIIGLGSGASILLLVILTTFQIVACVVISTPTLHKKLGTAAPSWALGTTLLLEMLLYHGFSDMELIAKATFIEISLFFIGILRGDERTRQDALGVPIAGFSIAVEAGLRAASTRMHAALVGPPFCVVMALHALIFHRYWCYSGAAYEIHRTTFNAVVAFCAVVLFFAAQDRSPSKHLLEKMVEGAKRGYKSGYARGYQFYSGGVRDGEKKRL